MTDLKNALVPYNASATAVRQDRTVSVTVEEVEDIVPLPATPLPITAASEYRIPRLPTTPPRPRAHRLNKKRSKILNDKVKKKELKKKYVPRHRRFCKICQVSCNGPSTWYDHIHSRSHQNAVANKKNTPYCDLCNREFESHNHLERHKKSRSHSKVVQNIQESDI